jgi:3-oxoacyl-[acyl-carrier protein] reductase
MELKGKTALVTGGCKGIGAAIAIDLAANGADVGLTYLAHEEKEAAAVVKTIETFGGRARQYIIEISDFEAVHRLVQQIVTDFGRLDILVNNAGVNQDATVWKMTEEQWDRVIDVDLKGAFNTMHAVTPLFRERGSGKIVNIASINGLRGRFGQANYAAAKAGLVGLTKTVAKEMGKYGVNVNAVAPGLIETDMAKTLPEEIFRKSISETVFGRIGQPEDVAYLVTFLCTEKARHITGEIIKVDGGQYI